MRTMSMEQIAAGAPKKRHVSEYFTIATFNRALSPPFCRLMFASLSCTSPVTSTRTAATKAGSAPGEGRTGMKPVGAARHKTSDTSK